tara:strand:+ start:244 stop:810 length:567 start_codon:yes stop_codon:yes gene_type:complete
MASVTKFAGTGANDTSFGTTGRTWDNPTRITASNNSYTTVLFAVGMGQNSNYLKATNFGFSIPAGATIDGVECLIEKKRATQEVEDERVRILNGDGSSGVGSTDKSKAGDWGTVEATATYGGSSDVWGETWSVANINSSNFGVVLSCNQSAFSGTATAYVDSVKITVHYTEGSGSSSSNKYMPTLGVG